MRQRVTKVGKTGGKEGSIKKGQPCGKERSRAAELHDVASRDLYEETLWQ
jgi:hypothetical protein